ncbi:flagellin [Terribacillus saccharophilus]|uniref:flagellin N-terminal helical domain-containing protein n=1 Tax=Terribacillus saccharophilus TaxID=361277 RepID=UPI003D281CBB
MRINHNIAALNTYNKLSANSAATQGSLEKLSSGLKINKAGDDAAGLAISEKMRGQIRGLDMASKNAQDGISLIQTAEGALNETHSILQRMRELSVQSSSDSNNDNDRAELQKEVDQLSEEITRISTDTEFNTKKLINGTASDLTFHIGANEGQNITLSISDMSSSALKVDGNYKAATETTKVDGVDLTNAKVLKDEDGNVAAVFNNDGYYRLSDLKADAAGTGVEKKNGATALHTVAAAVADNAAVKEGGINISNKDSADEAITTIQTAIDTVSAERSKLGAYQNRLDHTINNLGTSSENLTAAESRIRDVDYSFAA